MFCFHEVISEIREKTRVGIYSKFSMAYVKGGDYK